MNSSTPDFTWKRKIVENYVAKPLTVQLFKDGECVYECPPLDEVKKHCTEQIDTLWDEVLRFDNCITIMSTSHRNSGTRSSVCSRSTERRTNSEQRI